VRRVKDEADRLGLRTRRRRMADGAERGGAPFSRGHIYRLLSNPIYAGQIAHKGQRYPGQHLPLIDDAIWTAVQTQLATSAGNHRRRTSSAEPSFLAGLLVDAHGERLTPSHAVKKGRRYRYYVSPRRVSEAAADPIQRWRLPAREIEDCVVSVLLDALTNPARLLDRLDLAELPSHQMRRLLAGAARFAATLGNSHRDRAKVIRGLIERVIVDEKRIVVAMRRSAFSDRDVPLRASDTSDSAIELTAAVEFKRRGAAIKLVLPGVGSHRKGRLECDPALVKAIARGRAWFDELAAGRVRSLHELAVRDGITRRYIRRLVDLAFLEQEPWEHFRLEPETGRSLKMTDWNPSRFA
jgi:site-specific DNA recombinase